MKNALALLLFVCCYVTSFCQTGVGYVDGWKRPFGTPNNMVTRVDAIAVSGDTAYVGGNFSEAGYRHFYGAVYSQSSGDFDTTSPDFNEAVYTSVPDGSGGWYLGGGFTKVNNIERHRLVHILSNNSIDPNWNPGISDSSASNPYCYVANILKIGNVIYIAGNFTSVGDSMRKSLAAIDATTGAALSWNPVGTDASFITAIATNGTTLYAGGMFTSIGGQPRNGLAAIDIATGSILPWNPGHNGGIYTLAVSGDTVYVGGAFSNLGGVTRNNVGSVHAVTGLVTAYNPNADQPVTDIKVTNNRVYLCGAFSSIKNQLRFKLAATNKTNGSPVSNWALPYINNTVQKIFVNGNTLYAAGTFTAIDTVSRLGFAGFNTTTGALDTWAPNPHDENNYTNLACIDTGGNRFFLGGIFKMVDAEKRYNLAAYKVSTGELLPWSVNTNGMVEGITVSGNNVFFTGQFTEVNGTLRNYAAAADKNTGMLKPWNPNLSSWGYCITSVGSNIYIGGEFWSVNGIAKHGLSEFDSTTGTTTTWTPDVYQFVRAFATRNDTLYIGGLFNMVGGQPRKNLAAYDLSTHTLIPWQVSGMNANSLSNYVNALAIGSNGTLYFGGKFDTVGGMVRHNLAAINASTGAVTDFNPNADNIVWSLALKDSTLYAGGYFINVAGEDRRFLAAMRTTGSGWLTPWDTKTYASSIYTLNTFGDTVLAGGLLYGMNGDERRSTFVGVIDSGLNFTKVQINALANISVCSQDTVTFTTTAYNTGSNPSYQWLKNGVALPNATADTFNATGIANGDVFSVVLTSSGTGNPVDTSNQITISVNTDEWTGNGVTDNWSDADNWSCGAVPAANSNVLIQSGATVIVDVVAVCNNFNLGNGSNISFSGTGNSLHVMGTFQNYGTINTANGTLQVDNP